MSETESTAVRRGPGAARVAAAAHHHDRRAGHGTDAGDPAAGTAAQVGVLRAGEARRAGREPARATLETDPDFRAHLATQVRAAFADLGAAAETEPDDDVSVDSGRADDVAAYAFLVRPDGWSDGLACRRAARGGGPGSGKSGAVDSAVVERLEAALDQARGETKAVRDKLRAQLDQLKADNAQLRRTLGQTRVARKGGGGARARGRGGPGRRTP